jgi:hypothetical protein
MRRIMVGTLLLLSALAAGCQSSQQPRWQFPCTHRAVDAGKCDDPNLQQGQLFGAIVEGNL